MTNHYKAGESIRAPKIFYCFGSVPDSANEKRKRYRGTFSRNGFARSEPRLKRTDRHAPNEPDEIHCRSAGFECDDKPKLPGSKAPCGNHTCFTGYVTGDAIVQIKVPLRHHA